MYQDSRFLSLASRSYFSIVRSSTPPVRKRICPAVVDLPASTWPMKTRLRWSRASAASSSASASRAAASRAARSVSAAGAAAGGGAEWSG
jgi:hypothetical protein